MLEMKYPSQRLAYPYFVTVLVLFMLQITYGLIIAVQQVDPFFLQGILNFNINRSTHINLAVVWVLTGVIGTILFVGPLLGGRDLKHAWFARLLLVVVWSLAVWNGFCRRLEMSGNAGWGFGQPWWQ